VYLIFCVIVVGAHGYAHTSLMSQHPPNDASVSDTTPPPQTPSRKRTLESSAAEFIEKGWRLVENVKPKKEHPLGTVKETKLGETDCKYKQYY
jgi:hypothetical protein